ncbi:uncharacterized protein V1516DRAFT_674528 [Lipomyces oligophaga]|uniref:uncharacterized protein n=1 Tax=Lipomyces oligophaga TaxID=45792 RepID=UPI0034CE3AB1
MAGKETNQAGKTKPDPRFASVFSDPRFAHPKRKDTKIVLDQRFQNKLVEDKDFIRRRVVDQYGRKVDKDEGANELKRYYRIEDDLHDEESGIGKILQQGYDPARGEGLESSSDEEEEEHVDEEEDVFETTQESQIPRGDETSVLAVVNLDWDNVRSQDLMVAFSGFANPGRILSIAIYPSEFGKERMAQEELDGPPRQIFQSDGDHSRSYDDDNGPLIKEDNGEEFDSSKLRKYQLQRLRYYYGVVKCDSVSTARRIYDACDGTEYESTANFFDLRYVPEAMDFDEKPRDECKKVPVSYRPNEFVTDALQHSKVKLTWDETPNERLQFAKRSFSRREIEDMDFKAYLASESDSDEFDGEKIDRDKLRDKYKSLLEESKDNTGFDSKDDVDMEVTFTPGLATEGKAVEDTESTIDKYRRKEKERRQKRMAKNKIDLESDNEVDDELLQQMGESRKPSRNTKTKPAKQQLREDGKRKAELELLMMDENEETGLVGKHFSMREILKSEKAKKNKKVRRNKKSVNGLEDDFHMDVDDPRFKAVFEHHDYALDPSRPQFKDTNAMKKVLSERQRRQRQIDN